MRLAWFFYIGLSITVPFALSAQNTAWQALTIADGLSQGMVYDFLQDRTGFMWIATKDGLNRYDGYNFKVFTNDPYNPYSISGNTCTDVWQFPTVPFYGCLHRRNCCSNPA